MSPRQKTALLRMLRSAALVRPKTPPTRAERQWLATLQARLSRYSDPTTREYRAMRMID